MGFHLTEPFKYIKLLNPHNSIARKMAPFPFHKRVSWNLERKKSLCMQWQTRNKWLCCGRSHWLPGSKAFAIFFLTCCIPFYIMCKDYKSRKVIYHCRSASPLIQCFPHSPSPTLPSDRLKMESWRQNWAHMHTYTHVCHI